MKVIQLTRGYVAAVDDDDYEYLSQYKWHYAGFGYAARSVYSKETKKQTTVYMHVEVMGCPNGMHVDHIDGNNVTLRDVSKYPHRPYRSRITYDGKKRLIGDFKTQEDAARAYNEAAIKYFGEFAKLNDL